MTSEPGAYHGLRVLDLGQGVAAPYCGMLLALHGAEVVKLEPREGDWSRGLGTARGGHTALSFAYNRGKRSLALDLKAEEGCRIAAALATQADVVLENFRPGVAARLGLGYEALHALNPRLLYVSISGFGEEGPYAARPCTDAVAQAFSGLISINLGNDGIPHRVGTFIVDAVTGLYAAQTLATALFRRERRGEGAWLKLSLAECGAAILGHKLAEHVLEGGAAKQTNVPAGVYRTRDGWILVTLIHEQHFRRLAAALGRPDLPGDARFASFAARAEHSAVLFGIVREIILGDTSAAWLARFHAADLLCDRVNGFEDWLADPQVAATGGALAVAQPGMGALQTPRTPGAPRAADAALAPAPAIGEHSRAILAELGVTAPEIDRLIDAGTVRQAGAAAST